MTTSNAVEIASIPNVLSIPLEAVTSEAGYSYAFKKSGRGVVRQMIETGATNDNEIVVKKGLAEDDRVFLTPPADKATVKTEIVPGLQPTVPQSVGGDTAKSVTLPAKADSSKAGPAAEKPGAMKAAPKLIVPAPKANGSAPSAAPATKPKG
jgi:hypothetical protein